ncbi:MAG: patatin-like phospholipase family protein [Candidatus Competibacteraceae bacterium]|nr:patatin-like phospholipase family protein [Candidatus Competibacteraceae bacterium]
MAFPVLWPFPQPSAHAAERSRPRIGLALGGGGARGIAHIGVLKLLEEMRVPIDCIAGTSMGSIIGGLYASGMSVEQMSATLQEIDWPQVFSDGPPRADLPFRIKEEQRVLLNARVGLDRGQVRLPMGLLEGQNLLLLLEELSLPAASVHDFDELRIPYRAVATDLATGSPVVLGSGELAKAMRASMSIPSALVPVKIDGRLLADGGVANNVPVDVVRQLCRPDAIVAVNVGAPLIATEQLNSVLAITEQLTNILTVRNTAQQLSALGRSDVLIVPELKGLTSIDFNRAADAIAIGYAAAQAKRRELSRLATSTETYRAYLAALPPIPQAERPVIDFIRIKHDTRLSDRVIASQLRIKPGDRLDPKKLNRDLNAIYGMSEFQRVNYTLVRENGKTGLVVEARQQDIGPDTLRFGMFLGANLKGDSEFSVGGAYTMSALNPLGAQWRNFLQLGGNIALTSDFYQPLSEEQNYYVNPYFKYEQYNLDLSNETFAISTGFRVYRSEIGLEVGRNLDHWGRLAFGLYRGAGRNDFRLGQPSAYEGAFNTGGYSLRWTVDTLDNLSFPTSGDAINLIFRDSLTALGADREIRTLDLQWIHASTWGQYSIIPRVRLAGKLSGEAGIQDLFLQGGFLNLSGYQTGELSGQYAALAELIAMYRLNDASAAFAIPVFAGGSLELGGAWNDYRDVTPNSLIPAGSLFLGVDTFLGPFYLGAGYAEGGNASLYMRLGKLF